MRIGNPLVRCSGSVPLAALGFAALLLSGCQAARMPLPETLSDAEQMPVSGRQGLRIRETIRFGDFQAHQVRRSWTRGRDRGGATAARQVERRQRYEFMLRDGEQDHWFVACHASLLSVTIDLRVVDINPTNESAVYCNLQSVEDPTVAWEMELNEQRERPLAGTLTLGETRLQVVGTNRIEGALPLGSTSGYEFREGAEVIGAVQVINNGSVWLRRGLAPERRRVLSAAAAALLLLEDLRESAGS